ncbi:hypothetical protein GCM10009754_17980 [Amycolatopsis minnesotensis]|uniref:HTH araC/xylS-type domain-containing protein n=1 Tax=Amycolatopsis minnesotensis TaxID=337894 RepID=A0ABP5BRS2_9PSEU
MIAPNRPDPGVPPSAAVLSAIRDAGRRGARLMSFCTGAFSLAATGVLDGRRATTHWRWADLFAVRFPEVRLETDVLFVEDGPVFTSAGSAAAVSRRLVFAVHRDGGQRQFVERPIPSVPDTSLAPLLAWALERLDQPLGVPDLADRAAVSVATLHRRFRAELGITPLKWLTSERVLLACRLIERGEVRFDVSCGGGLGLPLGGTGFVFRGHGEGFKRACGAPSSAVPDALM